MKQLISTFILVFAVAVTASFAQNRVTRKLNDFTKISFRYPGKVYLRQGSPQKVELEGSKKALEEVDTEVEGNKLIIGKEGNWMDWNWGDDEKITVYITVPNIEGISVSGSGDLVGETKITSDDLDLAVSGSGSIDVDVEVSGDIDASVSGSGDLSVKGNCRSFESNVSGSGGIRLSMNIKEMADFGVSGSGKIMASGSTETVKTSISGSGRVLASDLQADRCDIRISGSGSVEINVKTELDATISGSGSVSYKGNPSKVNSHSSGSGKVRKM